jgi:hypothetical protein
MCLFEFIPVEGGTTFMKHYKRGASYRTLGTTVLYTGRGRNCQKHKILKRNPKEREIEGWEVKLCQPMKVVAARRYLL